MTLKHVGTDKTFDLTPCEASFEKLAEEDPYKLLAWIDSGTLEPADITFAAEAAGALGYIAIDTLERLLTHKESVAREGAVLGLARNKEHRRVQLLLRKVSALDSSESVRAVAADYIMSNTQRNLRRTS